MKMNEYIILRSPSISTPEFGTLGTGTGGAMAEAVAAGGDLRVETADLSKKDVKDLRRDSEVLSFAQNMPMKLHQPVEKEDLQETPAENIAWGVKAVGADVSPFTGSGVKVAILDTGIDSGHPSFAGVNILQKDFTGEGDGDGNGHGTHVAGTVFGQDVDGLRIGVAPGIDQALIGKVLGTQGGGSTESIVKAIEWASNNGANVISMSLGMDFPGMVAYLVGRGLPPELATSRALEAYRANVNLFNALATLVKRMGAMFQATIIVAASGNESRRDENPDFEIAAAPPSAAEGISAVGALGRGGEGLVTASFSNTKVDISAPGVGIDSAKSGGGFARLSGTSMATPHVAGVAALWGEKLLGTVGMLNSTMLSAKLISSGSLSPLKAGFDALDVGMGIVQAPQA